ncbi:MAG: PaaI family thioesterase [Lachnospiraceae bacterium]|nr:PaaI family thioesterase [Lachnospiraceae bacterium]
MGVFGSLEEARAYFTKDTFATGNGMEIVEIGEGTAVTRMTVDGRHLNAEGGVMGGVIFTLADFAFAAAVNNVHRPTVALQVSINYLTAPKDKVLIARAHQVRDGRTTCVYDIDVEDGLGRRIAQFVGTGYKL